MPPTMMPYLGRSSGVSRRSEVDSRALGPHAVGLGGRTPCKGKFISPESGLLQCKLGGRILYDCPCIYRMTAPAFVAA
jgi:hypothetical protein